MINLVCDILVLYDRACNQLGEEGHIECKLEVILLHFAFAPVDIHHIGECLEGKEGDADGKRDLRIRKMRSKKGIQSRYCHARILEEAKQSQVKNYDNSQGKMSSSGLYRSVRS